MSFLLGILPFVCLLGSALIWAFAQSKPKLAGLIAVLAALTAFIISAILSSAVYDAKTSFSVTSVLFTWIDFLPASERGLIEWKFLFDRLTAVMCLVVTGVGTLVHVYSIGYMRHDPSQPRYFAYLNLFLFSMLMLVLGGNLLVTFVGWELVGLASYLLIGFWFSDLKNAQAGRKAFVMNRIGDAGLLIAMFVLALYFGTLDYKELQLLLSSKSGLALFGSPLLIIIAAGVFLGAIGKSAQLPLFTWLPDAMAGPTPVSALIHAATMVTAGVYLCTRLAFVLSLAPVIQVTILAVAFITTLLASIAALFQRDLKAVLAYSTISQLGIMFIAVALGLWWLAIFHLVTHAFFKGCLFLTAGSVIDATHHEQDIAKLGGLRKRMPVTCLCFLFGALALSAIFPFAGYFSEHGIISSLKDVLAEFSRNSQLSLKLVYYASPFLALLTPVYMGRLFALVFLGSSRSEAASHATEVQSIMRWPVLILAALSLVGGLALAPFLPGYLSVLVGEPRVLVELHLLESILHSILPLGLFAVSAWVFSRQKLGKKVFEFQDQAGFSVFKESLFFDRTYRFVFVAGWERICRFSLSTIENLLVGSLGTTVAALSQISGMSLSALQSGVIRHYLLIVFTAFVLILSFCFLM
jgi:NADH-quinone oxidoreductase subunit L